MKRILFFTLVIIIICIPIYSAPLWVETYGSAGLYRLPEYLSGYGFSDLPSVAERLAAAQDSALSQLSRQVRMRVTSVEDYTTEDDGSSSSARYVTNVQTASELNISGARFEVYEQGRTTHALAYINTESLYRQFYQQTADARDRFKIALAAADTAVEQGSLSSARRRLAEADTELTVMIESSSVLRAIALVSDTLSQSFTAAPVVSTLLEGQMRERWSLIDTYQPADLAQAVIVLAENLSEQLIVPAQVMPLLYQDGDFSSTFGNRIALKLNDVLREKTRIPSTNDTAVIRGTYWVDLDQVEIYVTARSVSTGKVLASTHTIIPVNALNAESLKPVNMDTALLDGQMLLSDQIVDGGLEIEAWTDRGRNEHTLVFTEGEEVQFYFRVNQPAFLQLTYVLVTGDAVLLEESFYIGIDRVNRVVALPDTFQVVPPFGIERLIITAHSQAPPLPDVVPRIIEGQWYDVFRSVEDTVAATRGLAKVQKAGEPSNVRVGETSLVITTMAQEQN